jgi:hypothetical protein
MPHPYLYPLRRHTLKPQAWLVHEPESPVVLRMPHEAATAGVQVPEPGQAGLDERLADPLTVLQRV